MSAVCVHCSKQFSHHTNWNKQSRCCSKECSDLLQRECPQCKQHWTRKDKPGMEVFCSMKCGGEYNSSHGGTVCPLFY